MTTTLAAKEETLEEIAERIVGARRQPCCAICQTKMVYAPGAPEAHVPPHWYCRSDGGALPDSSDIATDEQEKTIHAILSALRNEREACAKVADTFQIEMLTDRIPALKAQDNTAKGIAAAIRGRTESNAE